METITFQKKQYRIREVNLPEIGNVFIAPASLNDALIINGNYVSPEVSKLDEQIYFFVDEDEINFRDEDLIKLIGKEVL